MNRPEALARLGLADPFTPDELRRAYRAQAKNAHPDTGGSAAAFQAVTTAAEYLGTHPKPQEPAPGSAWSAPPPRAAQAQQATDATRRSPEAERDRPGWRDVPGLVILLGVGWLSATAPWLVGGLLAAVGVFLWRERKRWT